MLVSAFAGYDNVMNAYKTAVDERYRFFSFGDAMFIMNEDKIPEKADEIRGQDDGQN